MVLASFHAIGVDDEDDDDYELCLGVICFDRAGYHVAVTAVGQSVNSKHLVGTRTRGWARRIARIFYGKSKKQTAMNVE